MKVKTEYETMMAISTSGKSVSRFGRCELKIAMGRNGLKQSHNEELAARLRFIMKNPSPRVIVCLPRIFQKMPPGKDKYYGEFTDPMVIRRLFNTMESYGSTFISRRDAWVDMLDEEKFWQRARSIWQDRPVLLVTGSDGGRRTKDELLNNASLVEVLNCPEQDAWDDFEKIKKECQLWQRGRRNPLIYAALGATAAVLCHDLATEVQALDLGHLVESWHRDSEKFR